MAIRDYTCDLYWTKELALKIQDFYHTKGQKHVKVRIEKEVMGAKTIWNIRSNISFKTPTDGPCVKEKCGI